MQQEDKRLCRKCKEQKAVIIIHKDPLCTQCFILYAEHQFKMALRMKCQLTQKNERILLCVSGGQNSIAMAKLTSDVVHNTCIYNKSKMFLNAEVLHIDESFVISYFQQQQYKKQDIGQFVQEECKLKYYEINIESSYDEPQLLLRHLIDLSDHGSCREDFIKYLKLHIILNFAIKNGFTKICFGQNGQRVAADLMAQLSKGKGLSLGTATKHIQQLCFPSKFFLNQFEQPTIQLQILRPMRELLNKDVLYYLKLKSNEYYPQFQLDVNICINDKNKNKPANGNIDHLLENFIDKLQYSFPATTFTVLSTSEKATFKPIPEYQYCPLCLDQIDKVYNRLEVETFDNSNQQLIQNLSENTKYYKIMCFSCKRMIQQATQIEQYYNMNGFPQSIIKIGNSILEQQQ